jgi:SPP1 gp7 family putative phage head morphogenesis protein
MASPYWEHRAELRQLAYDRANNMVVADVSRVYDRTMRQLNEDIDSIIGTYQRKTGLSVREAYDFLNQGVPSGVMDELRSRVAVITDPKQRKRLQVMLSTDAYRARISRLDAIKGYTRVGLTEAAEAELQAITPHLKGMIESGYSRTLYDIQKVSYGFAGAGVPRSALDMILKSRWSGEHYSSRVWGNRDVMAQILNRALMEQSTMGKLSDLTMQDVRGMVDISKWKKKVGSKFQDAMQYQKYAANRLIRTESAYVANQATAIAYEECGIERYEFIAVLDGRTSSFCQKHDGLIDPGTGEPYRTDKKQVGKNWPPLHPWCRSSTAPVLDTQNRKTMQRRAEGKDGKSVLVPRSMDYQQWRRWQNDGAPDDIARWQRKRIE